MLKKRADISDFRKSSPQAGPLPFREPKFPEVRYIRLRAYSDYVFAKAPPATIVLFNVISTGSPKGLEWRDLLFEYVRSLDCARDDRMAASTFDPLDKGGILLRISILTELSKPT